MPGDLFVLLKHHAIVFTPNIPNSCEKQILYLDSFSLKHGTRPKWHFVRAEFVIWSINFGFYCVIVNWWNIYTWIFQVSSSITIRIAHTAYALGVGVCKCVWAQHIIPTKRILLLFIQSTVSLTLSRHSFEHKQTHVLLFCVSKYFPEIFGGVSRTEQTDRNDICSQTVDENVDAAFCCCRRLSLLLFGCVFRL